MVSLNKALLNPYFRGGYVRGGWLTSHDITKLQTHRGVSLPVKSKRDSSFAKESTFPVSFWHLKVVFVRSKLEDEVQTWVFSEQKEKKRRRFFCFLIPDVLIFPGSENGVVKTKQSQTLNVWRIYLHLPPKLAKCMSRDNTLSIWEREKTGFKHCETGHLKKNTRRTRTIFDVYQIRNLLPIWVNIHV